MKRNPVFLIAGLALFLALADMPYGYYQLLRLFICGIGAYGAYLSYEQKKTGWVWILGIIAVLFNPLMKFYFGRETWKIIDFVAGVILCVYFVIKHNSKEKN